MSNDSLAVRRQAMENSFFHHQDQKLLEEFREHLSRLDRKAQLADASGIHDEAVLARLVAMELTPETLAALSLIPLVEVAWADGRMHRRQREAVVSAAEKAGVRSNDDAHRLLEGWLDERPDPEMLNVWRDYVRAMCARLDPASVQALKHDLLDRAVTVAEAAGGFLGLGNRISPEEQAMLDDLQAAFR